MGTTMRIGIDISQIVHEGTGVGGYVQRIVRELVRIDQKNEYVLFGASLRKYHVFTRYFQTITKLNSRVTLLVFPVPPTVLEFIWNRLHVVPIEWLIGRVDVFWSSDWTQPPLRAARGVTTIHDVSFLRFPETFTKTILDVQKRRLTWVEKECRIVLCDSEATKRDVMELVGIQKNKLQVVYPGFI